MDTREIELCLPSTPLGLCFKNNEFTKANFSVDQFVSEHRKQVSLEQLRDDLSTYLGVLHSAMVKLINKDYADFVNLSTNLVGLDKSLQNIATPLSQLRDEVLAVQSFLRREIYLTKLKMQEAKTIIKRKHQTEWVISLTDHLEKIESLIRQGQGDASFPSSENTTSEWSLELMERIALHLSQVVFLHSKTKDFPIIRNLWPRLLFIMERFETRLKSLFLAEAVGKNGPKLKQVLRIYASLGKLQEAENLFRVNLVKPYIEKVVTRQVFQNEGIEGLYKKALDFFPEKCPQILEVTSSHGKEEEGLHGFDFVAHAFWPELEMALLGLHMELFAPGDPNRFHAHYQATAHFLSQIINICPTNAHHQRGLQSLSSFTAFLERWNLSVYFQLRFQEIAGKFESSLSFIKAEEGSMFHLHSSHQLWLSLQTCWHKDVWLEELTPRFWKLTLQLLSRYIHWVKQLVQSSPPTPSPNTKNDSTAMQDSSPTSTELVLLFSDLELLHSQVPFLFENELEPKLKTINISDHQPLKDCIQNWVDTSQHNLTNHLNQLVVNEVVKQCSPAFRLVADLPRLYRKTNREVPCKPSVYVASIFSPLEAFLMTCSTLVTPEWRIEWTKVILRDLTNQYFIAANDVLTSVKKMEDSLKRLKRGSKGPQPLPGNTSMSDDDKIRLQLMLDVEHFGQKMREMMLNPEEEPAYNQLAELVKLSRPSTDS